MFPAFFIRKRQNGREDMQLENYGQLQQAVDDADLVLVGLGEEWVLNEELMLQDLEEKNKFFHEMYVTAAQNEKYRKLLPLFTACYYDSYIPQRLENAYKNMLEILEGKNYFVISLTVDPYLQRMGFKEERFVNPCGTYEKRQCEEACNKQLLSSDELVRKTKSIIDCTGQEIERQLDECLALLDGCHCTSCGADMVFNLLDSKRYLEEGYLERWQLYMKWLQGTLNKKLCVIEAGVGMKLPSVIRWRFEKIVFYNQKANMFRIHKKFYQVNEEVAERAYGCKCHSVQMFSEKNVEA